MKPKTLFVFAVLLITGISAQSPVSAQTWTKTAAPAAAYWGGLACSADGQVIMVAATKGVSTSVDSGLTWSTTLTNQSASYGWGRVAASVDGQTLFTGYETDGGPGYMDYSTNHGQTWASNSLTGDTSWNNIACSGDGTRVMGGDRFVYLSGVGAFTNLLSANYSVACSPDFSNLLAVKMIPPNEGIYRSTNGGVSWQSINATNVFGYFIAVSADGRKLLASSTSARIFFSADFGSNWSSRITPGNGPFTLSEDGTTTVSSGYSINLSYDDGATWNTTHSPLNCGATAISADGGVIYAAQGTNVWKWQTVRQPKMSLATAGTNLTLSWIIPSTPFVLQQSPTINGTNWVNIPEVPVLNPNTVQYQVTLPVPTSTAYFRLATQ